MSEDSAIPDELLDYSNLATGQDTALQKAATKLNSLIKTFNEAPRTTGITSPAPYAGNSGISYAARNTPTDQWVGRVGRAFLDVARGQVPPQEARFPDVQRGLGSTTVTTSDKTLSTSAGADSVLEAGGQEEAATLAAELQEAIWDDDTAAIKSILAQLARHQNDPGFNSTFFKQLGPAATLDLATQLGTAGDQRDLRIFDQALASATTSDDWDSSFDQGLFAPVGGVPPAGDVFLLTYGVYSEDFLTRAGDAVLTLGPGRPQSATTQDVATTLAAIARNRQAALDFLTRPPAGSSFPAPRLTLILQEYGVDLGSGPAAGAMSDLLRAASRSPYSDSIVSGPDGVYEPEIEIVLKTLGSENGQMVPPSLGPAIADVISQHIALFVPQDPNQHVNAGWTWQETVFKEAETTAVGRVNLNAVQEIEVSITQWGLTHAPQDFDQDSSSNITSWTTFLHRMGVLWGLAALPVRQAPYDARALHETQVNALLDIIGMIPFGNFIPAKYELASFLTDEGAEVVEDVGGAAASNSNANPDQAADDTYYQQLGSMNIALTAQFLVEHPGLVPKGADFGKWVKDIASGTPPAGAPAQVTQFSTDLASADQRFAETYGNPGRG